MRGIRAFIATGALCVAALGAGVAQASTVIFDNFDSDTQGLNWPGDSVFTSTSPPGSVDLIGPGFFDYCNGNGNCVDMDGSTGSGNNPAGQLTSTATVAPGAYTLSFLLGGNARGAAAQSTTVTLGNFHTTILLASSAPETLYTYALSTTGGQLVFTENGPSDQQGNILDNISLSTRVPEPATWAMMLLGLGLIGAGVRTGTKKTAPAAV
jgi:hypothetical protein